MTVVGRSLSHADRTPDHALRGCFRALLADSKRALSSCSQVAAGGDGRPGPAVEAAAEPVGDGLCDGVALGGDGETVFVVTQDLPELVLSFGRGLAAAAFDDALARRVVTEASGRDPPLTAVVIVQAAVTSATPRVRRPGGAEARGARQRIAWAAPGCSGTCGLGVAACADGSPDGNIRRDSRAAAGWLSRST